MAMDAHTAYVIPMAWMLTYEWYLYLVFALTLAVGLKPVARIGATWFTLCVAVGFLLQPTSLILQMATNPIVLEFLLGCLVAILYRQGYRLSGLQASILAMLRPLARLSDISYSLYLSHFFCLALFVRLQDRTAYLQEGFSLLSLIVFMLSVLVIAEIGFRCIEDPARSYFSKQRQATACMTAENERT